MEKTLFIVHVEHPKLGWLHEWAQSLTGSAEILHAKNGDLPDPVTIRGPVVVMGGPMGVGDIPQMSWLEQEAKWIGELMERDHPILSRFRGPGPVPGSG